MTDKKRSFFSVSWDLVLLEEELPYDLYINSSSNIRKEKFVRIFPKNGVLSKEDLEKFKDKYHQLYILESQRNAYLKSMVRSENLSDTVKTEVIKDSAIHYLDKVFDKKEFNTEVLGEAIEGCRDSVEGMMDVIRDYDISQVQDLIGNLSFHDFYTYDHSINVAMYSISILQALKPKATNNELIMVGLGGLLHDLGKIKIPTTIINNPGKLSDEDFKVIQKHPTYGVELIDEQGKEIPQVDFEIIKRVIHEHHENYNGTGYPNKIKGKDIHLYARITAIADFFDAITTKRSYHEVLSTEDALAVMGKSAGKKIDPHIFQVFTTKVSNIVFKGKTNKELPDNFDPCQPHKVLPFQGIKAAKKEEDIFKKYKEEQGDFGKVKKKVS